MSDPHGRNRTLHVVVLTMLLFEFGSTSHQVLLEEAALTRGAVALDGTPGMYYFKNATSTASRLKFHVYLEGGGWCTSTASCAKRALTVLGSSSSKFHDKTLSLPSGCRCDGGGYFSSSPIRNPLMHDWNQVFVNYLDGGSFSGNQSKPDQNSTGSSKIYYRGRRILDAVLDSLLTTQGMDGATDVVLSGCSAGGQAIFLQADYVASRLPPAAKFRTLADSYVPWPSEAQRDCRRFTRNIHVSRTGGTSFAKAELDTRFPGSTTQ